MDAVDEAARLAAENERLKTVIVELIAACQSMRRYFPDGEKISKRVDAAIAKATDR